MKSFFITLWFFIRSIFNNAAESFIQIERDGNQVIRDLNVDIKKLEESLVEIVAHRITLETNLQNSITKEEQIKDIIQKAVKAGDDTSALTAIRISKQASKESDAYTRTIQNLTITINAANKQLNSFKNERDTIASEIKVLAIEYRSAKLQETLLGYNAANGGSVNIQTLRDRVTKAKARTLAVQELQETNGSADALTAKYSDVTDVSAEEELARIKLELQGS